MSTHNDKNLIHMINQIAVNLRGGHDEETAAAAICQHLETFWARPMKQRLVASLEREDGELSPLARRAALLLAERLLAERQARST
ncbi:formate dehydrogenase subunit delta [Vreelandella venusta]|uniref:formate dehydrogenase subunit delta n=1 Tax=Vreelandella venusta TaxID=44935 RepID=UPI002010A350|nr:formate dehydrogenase subunit delta [Halomonas venusta]UQI40420.1 formate dehydrogenase subunit delta [Halomonas venusta]